MLAKLSLPDKINTSSIKGSIAIFDHEFNQRSSTFDDLHVTVFSQADLKYFVLHHPITQGISGHEVTANRLLLLGVDESLVITVF